MSKAKGTPFYEWHHWIRAQLRDLQPPKAADPEDEALLSGAVIGVGSLSDKDVGALLAGVGEAGEGQVPDSTSQRPAPSSGSTPKGKRAILRSWLTGGGGAMVGGLGGVGALQPTSDAMRDVSAQGRVATAGPEGGAGSRGADEPAAALHSGGAGGRMLPAAHMRDVVLKLLQQNMTLADKLKKSLQRRRALELALEVEVVDKEEARLHASAVKDVCSLLQAKIDEKEAILNQLDHIAAAGGLNCM
jgi:hypothetical protein